MSNDTQPIHPLRQRMIEDMTLRGLSAKSQDRYVRVVRACCKHMNVRPGDLTADHARSFLLYLQSQGLGVGTIDTHVSPKLLQDVASPFDSLPVIASAD